MRPRKEIEEFIRGHVISDGTGVTLILKVLLDVRDLLVELKEKDKPKIELV